MSKLIKTWITNKLDSLVNWESSNPILLRGEPAYVKLDSGEILQKIGDGTSHFSSLPYYENTIVDLIYPVGAIYLSVNNLNPASLFGGTWEQIQDRFLLAAGSTYAAGTTGGEASHQLLATELPDHYHLLGTQKDTGTYTLPQWGLRFDSTAFKVISSVEDIPTNASCGFTGGINKLMDNAHNNMPPYLTVYMWQRTA